MIKKDVLLNSLKDDLKFEDELVNKLTDFYEAFGWRYYVKDEEGRNKIDKGLEILREDTLRHVNILEEVIRYITACEQNEF